MADKYSLLRFTFILLIVLSIFSLSGSANFSSPNSTRQNINSSGNFSHLTTPFQIQDLKGSGSTPIIQLGYLHSSSQNQTTSCPNCSTEYSVQEDHVSDLEDLSPIQFSDYTPEVIGSNLDEELDVFTVVRQVLNSSVQNQVPGSANCLTVLEDPTSVPNSESFSSVIASNSIQEDEFSYLKNFCRIPFSHYTPEVDGWDFDGEPLDSRVDDHLTPISDYTPEVPASDLCEELDIFNGDRQSLKSSLQNQVPRSTNYLTENSFLEDPNSLSNSESFSSEPASNSTLEDEASNHESHVHIHFSDYTPRIHDSDFDEEPIDFGVDDHFSNFKTFSDSDFDEEQLDSGDHFSNFKTFSDHTPEIQDSYVYKQIDTFNGVSQLLSSSGYTKLATFLDKHLEAEFRYQGKLTIFAPLYRNINQFSARNFSHEFYSTVFKAHIVSDWLPWKELVTMKSGTELRTFLGDGHKIRVTRSVDTDVIKVNCIRVIAPDMYCSERLVVHGIENVLVSPSQDQSRAHVRMLRHRP